MNVKEHLSKRILRFLILLYPRRFRSEYSEEMVAVFAMRLQETGRGASLQPFRVLWDELRDWPGCLVREHIRERRSKMSSHVSTKQRPLQWIDLVAASVAFSVLPMLATVRRVHQGYLRGRARPYR